VTRWAILTGEYPPQPGGVSDYTRLVAEGLAAVGDAVTVVASCSPGPELPDFGVTVRRLPDHFGPRGLLSLDNALARQRPDRILIQYVPHSFGLKAMNLPFATWVAARARTFGPVWVMFHEITFPFRWRPLSHAALGAATTAMARLVAGAADRVFVSTTAWVPRLRRICPHARPAEWLPVPSNLPTDPRPGSTPLAERFPATRGRTVLGSFGTFGPNVAELLGPVAERTLARFPDAVVVLFGRGSGEFRSEFVARHPALVERVFATGGMPPDDLAAGLHDCDVLLQPYPDGITTRRGSAMAGLALGRAMVSNLGPLSESFWLTARCLELAAKPDVDALTAAVVRVLELQLAGRAALREAAAKVYRERFAVENTIARLRGPAA
jgi:glycosyltransferase involved in cell wall biosynthesis